MRRLLAAIPLLLWSSASWATCATATVQVKDNLGATPNMEITNGASTNCVGEIALVEGGALVSAANALSVQPGTGATWAVTQSGTWNLNNISGTISLPTGAATSANQPTNAAQASTTSGQTGTLVQGAVTTAAPTYTTAQTDPLSLTTAGALRVDASATTQPISGTITANQGGTWTVGLSTGSNTIGKVDILGNAAATMDTTPGGTAATNALQIQGVAGMTAVTVGGTVTANQGGSNWTQNLNQVNGTGAAALSDALANPTTFQLGSDLLGWDSTNTVWRRVQVDAGTGTVKVDPGTVTVTGTVTANQGGTWNINNISGTVSLPTGAATSANQPTNAAQGSTTSGQTGNLMQGAVTTGSPTYTTGQTDPFSLTTAGALRVDGSAVTQPISATSLPLPTGAATSANQTNASQKTQIVDGSGNVIASTSNNLNVQCANCSGSGVSTADQATFTAGASLFAGGGGFYQTNPINAPLASGQQGEFQVTSNRAIFSNLRNSSGTEVGTAAVPLITGPPARLIPDSRVMLCPTSVPGEYLPCGSAGALPLQVSLPAGQFPSQTTGDPCFFNAKSGAAINLTGNGQVITGTPGKRTYICSLDLVSGAAQNIALVEGTGATCATNIFGLAGGTTAATGWNLAANGGLVKGNGGGTVYTPIADTNSTGANVCLLLSGAGQTSGQITYVQQ